ncbi:serine/threonine-protein kinase [Mycobacterium sp.]|jgi:serine/threonine-protein kinase|uniref:serine/threonine-protein kinase n=1 Tax=Mycobacterium sp. TaxID=1785 RepID=UPI002D5BD876|nr:protein kinase [Mycobacterium sp.]HZA12620.1 protein kinase [Mycobacterium sp.]
MVSSRAGSRVGTMFGPYELRSLIGIGGMGEVYRAYDTVRDRMVALKLLRTELAADADFQERFRRESRVAARLQEPHVIPVHDWGDIGGVLYIDMRLVEGANLKTVLAESGPLDPARAASIVAQVAAALDAAHADGLVHRDVKPENVLLTPSGFVYLVDFGIAHLGGDSGLTSAGAAIGSCVYMAPERFANARVGPQADVYSLACVLYECLTGRPPFPAGEVSQLISAHLLAAPPRPSAARPGLNPAFDGVIARGMAKEPRDRFSSAGELAGAARSTAALDQSTSATAAHHPQPASTRQFPAQWPNPTATGYTPYLGPARRPPTPVQQRRGFGPGQLVLAGAAVALLILALAAALWLAFGPDRTNAPPASVAVPPSPSMTQTTSEPTTAGTSPRPSTTTSSPPASQPANGVSGADARGFLDYPNARCDAASTAAAVARTTKSVLVVCRGGSGNLYYRGVRLSDGASIELADAVRSPGGWDVTNPADGTRYVIRPDNLTIARGSVAETEPMVEYASN